MQCSVYVFLWLKHLTESHKVSFNSITGLSLSVLQNFREQRIDGSSLPLLTEDHLTTTMGMKLGPALKLRATLSRRLGHCAICMHCVHCHNAPSSLAAIVSPAQTPPSVLSTTIGRPNSTGNWNLVVSVSFQTSPVFTAISDLNSTDCDCELFLDACPITADISFWF